MLSAIGIGDFASGGMVLGDVATSARRARWLRPYALPPRAPRWRSCSGLLLKRIWELFTLSPTTTFIRSVREHMQVKSGSPTQI